MVKRTIRFPVVWEAVKNNMSKLRAMRIKRRESGYWGLISVRFSRACLESRTVFEREKKKKKRKITHSILRIHRIGWIEWWIESGNCASGIRDLVIDPFSNVIKIDECLYWESRLERWIIRNRDKIGLMRNEGKLISNLVRFYRNPCTLYLR